MNNLVLPPVLDLRAAALLRTGLLQSRDADLQIDASEVRQLGGLCLQVLLSAHATWQADGRVFQLGSASDEFVAGMALFGAGLPHASKEA